MLFPADGQLGTLQMELTALITILLILAVLLCSGLWIGPTLFITGWIALSLFTDRPVLSIMGSVV